MALMLLATGYVGVDLMLPFIVFAFCLRSERKIHLRSVARPYWVWAWLAVLVTQTNPQNNHHFITQPPWVKVVTWTHSGAVWILQVSCDSPVLRQQPGLRVGSGRVESLQSDPSSLLISLSTRAESLSVCFVNFRWKFLSNNSKAL